ncbi:hypothetical protein ACVWXU_002815 [Streptomyces sp. TE33382]
MTAAPAAQFRDASAQPGVLRLVHPVGLVQHHEIGDGEMAVDLGMALPGPPELGGVHDLDQSPVPDVRVVAGQQHPYELLGFGETARFDDDHIEAGGGPGQRLQEGVEFARVDGAAQTAVAERDRRADLARDGHGVDLDGSEIVDDHADPVARPVAEQMVEQRRLAGSQETRQDDDRNLRAAGRGQRGPSSECRQGAGTGWGGGVPT